MAATQAVAFGRAADDKYRTASALLTSGQIAFSIVKADIAIAAVTEAVPLFKELDDKAGEAAARLLEAELHSFNGRFDAAYDAATLARGLARSGGDAKVEQRALHIIQKAPPKPTAAESIPAESANNKASLGSAASASAAPHSSGSLGLAQSPGLQMDMVKAMMLKIGEEILSFEEELSFDANLMDVGLDSLTALTFRNSLRTETGLKLPGTLMYDYPTLRETAVHIVEVSRIEG